MMTARLTEEESMAVYAALASGEIDRRLDLDAMYHGHVAKVHRFVASRLGHEAAFDMTAIVYIEALGMQHTYDPEKGSVVGWLMGIANNVVNHERRSRAREAAAYEAYAGRRSPDEGMAFDDEVVERDAVHQRYLATMDALEEASESDRTILNLAADELTYEEIARVLEVPIGTVRSRLGRARSRLRAAVEAALQGDASVDGAWIG